MTPDVSLASRPKATARFARFGHIRPTIFATGGYAHNPEFLAKYQRARFYGSCAMPMATGDFINIAGAAGARLGSMGGAWRTQIVLEEALVSPFLAAGVFYPPGDSMLQVNKYGLPCSQ